MKIINQNEKVKLKKVKKFSKSSQAWLLRQLNDPYVKMAERLGYRSRSAFKLIEINEKYKIISQNSRIIDLGSSPGGWSQVIAKLNSRGKNIAVDLNEMKEIFGIEFFRGNFLEEETFQKILSISKNGLDLILSDMASNSSGIQKIDHIRIILLLENVFEFAINSLAEGGHLCAKVLIGGTEGKLLSEIKKCFQNVFHFKPNSSRKDSSEMYLIAKNFRK